MIGVLRENIFVMQGNLQRQNREEKLHFKMNLSL